LPRGIVAKVVESILEKNSKPNTDQVFTKKYGYEALKDSIIDSIDNINEECVQKTKLKNVWSPFPKKGVFLWPGIEDLMVELLTIGIDGKKYSDIVETVESFFNSYVNKELMKQTINWNKGEIPNTNADKRLDYNEIKIKSYIKEKLVCIMVHRLIVMNEALKNKDYNIKYPDLIDILKRITNRTTLIDNYFYTSLGLQGTSNDKSREIDDKSFKLDFINLFPHEYKFVKKVISVKKQENGNQLSEVDKKVIKKVFAINSIIDNWNKLNLDFNIDSENLTQNEFIRFLTSIEANSNESFAKQIYDDIVDLNIDDNHGTLVGFLYSFIESEEFSNTENSR